MRYHNRPDYDGIQRIFESCLLARNISYNDKLDWETDSIELLNSLSYTVLSPNIPIPTFASFYIGEKSNDKENLNRTDYETTTIANYANKTCNTSKTSSISLTQSTNSTISISLTQSTNSTSSICCKNIELTKNASIK